MMSEGGPGLAGTEENERTVIRVVESLRDRRVEDAMTHYNDDSVFRIGDEEVIGVEGIRTALTAQVAGADPSGEVDLHVTTDTSGRVVLDWLVRSGPGGEVTASGQDFFVVADGMIVSQLVVPHV